MKELKLKMTRVLGIWGLGEVGIRGWAGRMLSLHDVWLGKCFGLGDVGLGGYRA